MSLNPEIKDLIEQISNQITKKAYCSKKDAASAVNVDVITAMIDASFWSSQKSKLYVMDDRDNVLNSFSKTDVKQSMANTFGDILELPQLSSVIKKSMAKDEKKKVITKLLTSAWDDLFNYIIRRRQRDHISMRVDMFTEKGSLILNKDGVEIIYPHSPFTPKLSKHQANIVDDFKEHFPQLDNTLHFIIASRFAADRKQSYLWWQASSDFGKGFLMSTLKSLGIVTEVSVKEVEKMFEGAPVGRSEADFKNSMVLCVDEFKTARSEMKQLQSEMQLSPKNQLSQTVQLYTKIFMSAEDVPSFASDDGIEDQFANRFSYIRSKGSLPSRQLFKSAGKAVYFDNIQTYVATRLNGYIMQYQELGRDGSASQAEKTLAKWWEGYNISKTFKPYAAQVDSISEEFTQWMISEYISAARSADGFGAARNNPAAILEKMHYTHEKNSWYLSSAQLLYTMFINQTRDKSVAPSLIFKKGNVATKIAVMEKGPDGKLTDRPIARKFNNRSHKVIRILIPDDLRDELMSAYKGIEARRAHNPHNPHSPHSPQI